MSKYRLHKHRKQRHASIAKKQVKPMLVDRLTYFAAIVEPLVTIPQIYLIFHSKNASSISISAWLGFEVFTSIWLWYGFVHKEKMILIYQGLFFILDGIVIIGAIMYGGHW